MTNNFSRMAAVAAAAFLISTGASASQRDVTITGQRADEDRLVERVGYGDLDLTSAKDRSKLQRRVRLASSNVCAPLNSGAFSLGFNLCRNEAIAGARPQMERAFERAAQLAATGHSDLPEVAIAVRASTAVAK